MTTILASEIAISTLPPVAVFQLVNSPALYLVYQPRVRPGLHLFNIYGQPVAASEEILSTTEVQRTPTAYLPTRLLDRIFPNTSLSRLSNLRPHPRLRQAEGNWKAFKRSKARLNEAFKELVSLANDAGGYDSSDRDHTDAAESFIAALNSSPLTREKEIDVVERLNKLFEETVIHLADCGHFSLSEEVDGHGRTYCESCADNLCTCADDDERYPCADLHYWDCDGCYHFDPEGSDDDDDGDDEADDRACNVKPWSTDCSRHVSHENMEDYLDGEFTMGLELEVEPECERLDAANDTYKQLGDDYIVLKADGSLAESGFEIVTAARKLKYHVQAFKDWKPYPTLRSWDSGNCGMHVHIDSRAFQALHLGKFLMFINSSENKSLIKNIAGRHPTDGGSSAVFAQALPAVVNPSSTLKDGNNTRRHQMVNLCNLSQKEATRLKATFSSDSKGSYSTVELRIFRGSLKKDRLLAQIEFAHAAVCFSRDASWSALTETDFKVWLKDNPAKYSNLIKFLKG